LFEKCAGCGSRILAGGVHADHRTWCSDDCLNKSVCLGVDQLIPLELVSAAVDETFYGDCPSCGGPGPVDLYTATKLTGMLFLFTITRPQKICCAKCARIQRLQATAHNLFLGWWGVRCCIANLFVLPYQIGAAALTRTPKQPSPALIQAVKLGIANSSLPSQPSDATDPI
jgi:hypothetical protein